MNPPRIKGRALAAVRALTYTPPGARATRLSLGRDFQLDALFASPIHALGPQEYEPRPIAGAPPRSWEDQGISHAPARAHRRASQHLVDAYKAKKCTPSDVFDLLSKRIEDNAFGASTHSPFVALDLERGRRAAAASTERYLRGEPLGPLDGIPIPLKDQHDLAGLPTRGGTSYRTEIAEKDGYLPRILAAAGVVLYGKTHTTEYGMTPSGINPHFRVPRNPYASDRAAGGSSTGSGVAVALGLATIASGSDGGGSIRTPAALTGVYGIKPTFVRVGHTGDIFGGSVSTVGPLAQGTTDLVEFLCAVRAAPDAEDPLTTYQPDTLDVLAAWRKALGRGVKGALIGLPRYFWREVPSGISSLCMDALRALEREGAILREVDLPWGELALPVGTTVIGNETLAMIREELEHFEHLLSDDLRINLNVLRTFTAEEFLRAQRVRQRIRRSTAKTLSELSLLAMPSTLSTAPNYPLADDFTAITDVGAILPLLRNAFLANLTGLPAGSVPVGRDGGLPVGLQFVGDAWDEASVFAAMAAVERTGLGDLPAPADFTDLLG